MKARIYLETSFFSYLAAKPSMNMLNAVRQRASLDFWQRRDEFEILVSDLVVIECSRGDADAAALRRHFLQGIERLSLNAQVLSLAETLLDKKALPSKAKDDATHIAIAAVHHVDAIVSWNFKHIASAWARRRIELSLQSLGFNPPVIATPDELLEGEPP